MKIEQIKEGFDIDIGAPMPTILSNEHQIYLISPLVRVAFSA
ncbi:hypothetical protein [Mangrovivirga cuniculi]|nr:hypothetical protein [Mangrovivirga cuniculi]